MDDLQFEVGFMHGHAVAYSPSTGHIAYEPLRSTARRLQARGAIVAGADLLHTLDYVDDRPTVGAGKVAKKLKKAVSKVKTVAKKVAASKLGKVIKFAAAAVNPAAGATMLAISTGKKLAKAAAKKPHSKAAKAAPIASALAAKKITPKQATKKSKAIGVPPKHVKSAAVALRVKKAADAGNPKAQELMATSAAIDAAQASPAPLSIAPPAGGGGGGDPFASSSSLSDTNPLAEQPGDDLPEPSYDDDGAYDDGAELEPLDDANGGGELEESYDDGQGDDDGYDPDELEA